jgi:heme-degrading monooxygenase HmoA
MIEVCLLFNLYKDVNEDDYAAWAKKAIVPLLKSPGIVEFKAHRNILGTPQVRLTTTWNSLNDWARFAESSDWLRLMGELSKNFAADIEMTIWAPSPIAPGPLRPSK